jgi:hypothetical protein
VLPITPSAASTTVWSHSDACVEMRGVDCGKRFGHGLQLIAFRRMFLAAHVDNRRASPIHCHRGLASSRPRWRPN